MLPLDYNLENIETGHREVLYVVRKEKDEFEVLAKTLTGKQLKLWISPTDTIGYVSHRICALEGMEPQHLHLISSGKSYRGKMDTTVAEAGWKAHDEVHITVTGCFGHREPNPYIAGK